MAHLLIRNTVLPDRRLPIPGKVVVLGRSLDSDVPILHPSVSRRHALLEYGEGGYLLSDLGSSNGTFLAGRRLASGERERLPLGTRFRLGQVDLVLAPDEVLLEKAPAAAAAGRPAPATLPGSPRISPAPATLPAKAGPALSRGGGKGGRRASPAIAKRVALRRKRRDALRWLGLALTLVLVVLAAVFVRRILARSSRAPETVAAPEEERSVEEDRELKTLTIDGRGDEKER